MKTLKGTPTPGSIESRRRSKGTPTPGSIESRLQERNDLQLLPFNPINVSFLKSFHFATPTPEELAKAEEEKTNKLIEDVTKKVTESVDKKWQAKYDSLAAEV